MSRIKSFRYTGVDVMEALWLQEMMMYRNENRDAGSLQSWYERWLHENGSHDTASVELCLTSLLREAKRGGSCCAAGLGRLRESEVYFGYLERMNERYTHARVLGRRIQRILHASQMELKYPEQTAAIGVFIPPKFAEFRGLAEVWYWAPTTRGKQGALESDWDMQDPMSKMDKRGYSVLRRVMKMEEPKAGWQRVS